MNHIKFFDFKKIDNNSWFCAGLSKMNGHKTFTSFNSRIYIVDDINDIENTDISKLHVYGEDKKLYCIMTTLGGTNYLNNNRKTGLSINPNSYDLPETVFISLIGSIFTVL